MFLFCNIAFNDNYNKKKRKSININEDLFLRIANGDMGALEELYYLTDKSVYAFAMSILKNQQDAQDVMQETYIKIKSGAHLYKPYGKPLAWILTIVKNLSLIKIRGYKKNGDGIGVIEDSINLSYEENNDDKIVMDSVLNILSEEERKLVVLHCVTGMKHNEAAKLMGIGLSTELSKYNRALKKLRKYIEKEECL